jgi:LPS sulfotransferase NodH
MHVDAPPPVGPLHRVARAFWRPTFAILNGAAYRQLRTQAPIYTRALRGRPSDPGARVLIFAQGRSGTTLLESLMCSTGLFRTNDEPLIGVGRHAWWPGAYLRGLARDTERQGPGGNFVCHVKIDHLYEYRAIVGRGSVDPKALLRELVRDGWHIVYVWRENRIRHLLSSYVGRQRGEWHKRDDRPENTRLVIDRGELEADLAHYDRLTAREQQALRGIDHFSLTYERDLLDSATHERTVDTVLKHVGLERSGPVSTTLRKINNRPISDIVENYDEFAEWVRALGFGKLLDDPHSERNAT